MIEQGLEFMLMMILSLIRGIAIFSVAGAAALFLCDISNETPRVCGKRQARRRAANPALRAGIALAASGSTGLGFLVLRQVLLLVTAGEWRWFLFHRDPDLVGEIGITLCSTVVSLGILLIIRGARAILVPRARGDVPRPLGPTLANGKKGLP